VLNERRLAEQSAVLKKSLQMIDSYFLKDQKFITGICIVPKTTSGIFLVVIALLVLLQSCLANKPLCRKLQ